MDISSYKKTSMELAQDLAKLEVFAKDLEMENVQTNLHELNERVKNDRFNLAVLGEFRRGKSTLINAMLRTPVLPSDVVPTTACVNRITYDPQPRARVRYGNGEEKDIDISELTEYATKDGASREGVQEVTVWYPTVYCANNVDIYDTPGLNDSEDMTRATMNVLYRMDVAIFTLSADVNFSESEINFVSEKLLTSSIGKVIFVVTRMGSHTPENRIRILDNIRKRISTMVLGKAEKVFEDNPEELESFRKKIGELQIYGVDSVMALQARKNYDAQLLEESGFPAFERAVDELLTRERGRVMLEKQTGAILKSANEIYSIIQAKLVPLTVDEETFAETCRKTEAEINAIEELANQEFARLDESQKNVQALAKAEWDKLTAGIREKIRQTVLDYPFESADLKKRNMQETAERVWDEQVVPMINREMQIGSEQIQNHLNEAVGRECSGLAAFEEEVAKHCENIQLLLQPQAEKTPVSDNVRDSLLNFFTAGGGNVCAGYKVAGVKGALVGGLSGAAINLGGAFLIGAICGLAGLAVTWPVALAAAGVSAVAGLIGGKKVVEKVFSSRVEEMKKSQIADVFCQQFTDTIAANKMDKVLEDHIRDTFAAIKAEIAANTTGSAKDLQKALQTTREQFAAEKGQLEQKLQIYTGILESLSEITGRTREVRQAYGLDQVAEAAEA